MDAKLLLKSKIRSSPLAIKPGWNCLGKQVVRLPSLQASLSGRPADHDHDQGVTQSSTDHRISTVYHDSWLDRLAINHFSNSIQTITGIRSKRKGYEGMLEICKVMSQKFNPKQQRELAIKTLQKAFPAQLFFLIKIVIPQLDFSREMLAAFTTMFFAWLVGPSEVRESEIGGRREKNVVHIKKCRLLEGSNCAGICINQCKFPTQTYIKNSLGVPVNMVPNFEDMSCEMIFGEEPPEPEDDPASGQPCYKLCSISRRHTQSCPS